jgi:hypothetical protein
MHMGSTDFDTGDCLPENLSKWLLRFAIGIGIGYESRGVDGSLESLLFVLNIRTRN